MENNKKLSLLVKKMIGNSVWDFHINEATNSIISFECGEKIKQNNTSISAEIEYEGQYSFMIYCSWRITDSSKIVTSWKDETHLLKQGVSIINNKRIIDIEISSSFDVFIKFENGFVLDIFCDLGINDEFDCNWFFRENKQYYSVNNHNEIEVE